MSFMKCPQCGRGFTSSLEVCPHCGYKNENVSDDTKPVKKVVKRNQSVSVSGPMKMIIIGIVLCFILVGIVLIVLGAIRLNKIKKNNAQKEEILYYEYATGKFTAYDSLGNKYEIEKEKIAGAITFEQFADGYIGVVYNNEIHLGWASAQAQTKFNEFIQNL